MYRDEMWVNAKSHVRKAGITMPDTMLKVIMGKCGWLIVVQI
jgi:hypothetical protein